MVKGYKAHHLDRVIQEVSQVSQAVCLRNKEISNDDRHEQGFITNYRAQYREVGAIFMKHWEVLCLDKTLR